MRTFTSAKKARGAAAIEFSLIFIILLMLLYGVVGYFGPLLLAASYQQVASEALREAVTARYQPGQPLDLQQQVHQVIQRSWLPPHWVHNCPGYPDNGFLRMDGDQWRVCVRHNNPAAIIISPFKLFGREVPKLPDDIRGEAVMCIRGSCD